ncbi:MAG TPA: hypothetical protein VG898_09770 [Solirubrobacterales bacterium]|nr:hypothetical protein [Solirubrobacterales bacterium]
MTEGKAFVLIGIASVLLTAIAVPTLLALGVNNDGASLGMIVPMVLGGLGIGWVGVHYGDYARRR